jgi:hypothetical protein
MKGMAFYKHCIWLLFTCSIVLCAKGQDMPVQWTTAVEQLSDSTYILRVTGSIKEGWYVYAAADERFGLEAVSIHWKDPRIKPVSPVKLPGGTVVVADNIFNARLPVYTGKLALEQCWSYNLAAVRK